MQSIRDKINETDKFGHILAYCTTFIGYGCVITAVGPAIPYFSADSGLPETEYSFLFFCRTTGFIFGALTLKVIERYFEFHSILVASSIFLFIFLTLFTLTQVLFWQGIMLGLVSISSCFLEVMVNVCVLQTQKHGDLEFWMLICHGVFGIGGLIGPYLVYLFEVQSFIVMGLMVIVVIPFYLKSQSPQNSALKQQKQQKTGRFSELQNTGHEGMIPALEKTDKKVVSKQIQRVICLMFWIYIGLEVGFGGWISSYAVLEEVATKQQATSYASIFWISMTICRFLSSCVTYKSTKKLLILCYSCIVSLSLVIVMVWIGQVKFACMLSSIALGAGYSAMFPLFLTMPNEYNLSVTSQQNSTFMVCAALGEGVLSMAIGYSMALFTNHMLFYMLLAMVVLETLATYHIRGLYLKEQSSDYTQGQEMSDIKDGTVWKMRLSNF